MTRRARLRALRCGLVLGAVAATAGAQPAAVPGKPGTLVPDLATESGGGHRYALYLPPTWTAEGSWPVLVVLDPRGRAVTAAEIFRPAAERYGWVVVSSYDSRSDQPAGRDPNTPALEALLDEVDRYGADGRRIYLAGFSGTSKFAWGYAHAVRGAVAGIIGCGGALPGPWEQWNDPGFVYYGAAGTLDFNHRSMHELDDLLDATGVAHRFVFFDGGHQWLDAELADDAMGWMELQAMKHELRERDVVVVERLYDRWLTAAAELEASGQLLAAWRVYSAMAGDFEGLRPVTRPAAAAERLGSSPAVTAARAELTAALKSEKEFRERLGTAMRSIAYQSKPKTLETLLAELEIEALREVARGDSLTAQAARRKLELVFLQAAFYVPRVLFASGAPRRAALSLEIAVAVKPEAAETWFQLARARAQAGENQEALASLERAIDNGFTDAGRLRAEPSFAELRGTRAFRRLTNRLR